MLATVWPVVSSHVDISLKSCDYDISASSQIVIKCTSSPSSGSGGDNGSGSSSSSSKP